MYYTREEIFAWPLDGDYHVNERTRVHKSAVMGPDAVMGQGARMEQYAVMEQGARMERGAVMERGARMEQYAVMGQYARMERGAVMKQGAVMEQGARMEQDAVMGQYAVMGQGARMEQDAVMGQYAVMGQGARMERGAKFFADLGAEQTRKYSRCASIAQDGKIRINAGCHHFTLAKARAHWGSPDYVARQRGDEYLALVDYVEALCKIQGVKV